jgi:hypothetical protein
MTKKTFFLTFTLTLSALISVGQQLWTIGPMLHYNFGGEKRTTSFAIEAAYWDVRKFPYGFDFAIEFDKAKVRLYSEAQTGIGVAGIAIGPVVEFNTKEHHTRVGLQGSVWANYFLGFDYRFRTIDKEKFHAFGIYGKLPIAHSGFDEDGTSTSNWGDFDD